MAEQICLVPRLQGLGGMVSFQSKLIQGLDQRGIQHNFDPANPENKAILVIGGTKNILPLLTARQRGVKIVQRLNGMNWLHKVQKTPFRKWLYSQNANALLALIRRFICREIIYQSQFSKTWWEKERGSLSKNNYVIYNGVDIEFFKPDLNELPLNDHYRVLLVEGNFHQNYLLGLETAVTLVQQFKRTQDKPVELIIAGQVPSSIQNEFNERFPDVAISWKGVLNPVEIRALDRTSHLMFSTDINAACPNSVIEALACGLPVLAYDTGALAEIVQDDSGKVVPWGSNYWKLEPPDLAPLVEAAQELLLNNDRYRLQARQRAINAFSLDKMVEAYLEVLLA